MKIWRLYDVTIFDPERIAGERIFPIFSPCPYKQKPEEENLLFLLPVLFVSFLSSYFPSISFNSSSTAAFNCVSSPFTTVSGELATLISGSNCEFSR